MSTGRDLVTASLRLLGAVAPGESLDAAEASDGLTALNRMLDTWSNEKLLVFAITQESPIALTGGVATYTLGAGGNITTRPMEIEAAFIRDGQMDYAIKVRSVAEYAAILNKSVQSDYPSDMYDDGGYPQRTITLYPTPASAKSLVLYTKRPLSQVATLDTTVSLPPGYEEAIIYNLATRLAPEYGKAVTQEVMGIAVEAKSAIKRENHRPDYLRADNALLSRHGRFNINTGDYTR